MRIIKKIFVTAGCLLAGLGALSRAADAPIPPEIENEQIYGINKEAPHATLMPYVSVKEALGGKRRESAFARSLNGTWKFNWVKRPELRPVDFFKPDFDVSAWKEIPVPSCWQLLGYGTPYYRNAGYIFQKDPPKVMSTPPRNYTAYDERNPVGSYRRDFEVPADWNGRRVFITFDGVDSAFFLWVNGQKVGFSVDSRTPAEFDITKYVKPGKNVLAAEVYRFSAGSYLEDQDMWRLSGIFRNVTLWSAPTVHIRDFFVKTDLDAQYKDATVAVSAKIKNYGAEPVPARAFAAALLDKNGRTVTGRTSPSVKVPALQPGEEKEVSLSFKVADPAKWTAETPNLYTFVPLLAGEQGKVEEILSCRIGFRKIEIKGPLFLVNGVPIKLKGANRHENWPDTGHYVSEERMIKDLELLKGCNSNHVRTCHYSDDPRWYELCDEWGIYLVAETNVECHGAYGQLDRAPNWQKQIVERNIANVESNKNHASVIIWSFGNENGGGDNFRAAHDAVRKLDPTRPTHYEPFGIGRDNPCEIDSNMYPSVDFIKSIGESKRAKPYYMCEYAHAMSNSMGSISDYNDVIDAYDGLLGGAIWEWQDQALWNDRDKTQPPYLVYGGGFGETPNDGVFILKGVVFADRTPTPKYPEVKHAYQWVGFKDLGAGRIEVKNKYAFTNLGKFVPVWSLTEDGKVIFKGKLDKLDVAPRGTKTVEIPGLGKFTPQPGSQAILRLAFELEQDELWAKAGAEVAEQQFILPNTTPAQPAAAATPALTVAEAGGQITVSGQGFTAAFSRADGSLTQYSVGGADLIAPGGAMRLYAYRAPHLNDDLWAAGTWRANGLDALTFKASSVEVGKAAGGAVQIKASIAAEGKNNFGFALSTVYTVFGDGTVAVDSAVTPHGRRIVLPRIGFRLALDKSLGQVSWLGRGPLDNYSDRKRGSDIGLYSKTVKELLTPFVAPMECGNHEDVRWASATNAAGTGLLVAAQGAPLQFSALPFSDQQLEKAKFSKDLTGSDATYLCLSARTLGVGSAGCGPKPLDQYIIYSDPLTFSFLLRPVTGAVKDVAALARQAAPARVMPVLIQRDRAGLITLGSETPEAKISYTVDGVTKDYTAPFEFKKEGTLKVQASAAGSLPYSGSTELGKYVEVIALKAVAASSFQSGEGEIKNAVDGDPATFWHTRWSPVEAPFPHWLTADCGRPVKMRGLTYQGRSDMDHGRVANYEIYLSNDGKEWGQPVATGRFSNTTDPQDVILKQPATARYIKFVALSEINRANYATIAELGVLPAQ